MNDKKLVSRYYLRAFHRGRTAVSRIVDFIAMRLVLLAAGYLFFSTKVDNGYMAGALSLAVTLFVSAVAELVKSIRMERFVSRERKRFSEKLFHERLVRLTREEFMKLVRGYLTEDGSPYSPDCLVYPVQTAAPVTVDAVLLAAREGRKRKLPEIVVITSSSVSDEARDAASRCEDSKISFVTAEELTRYGEAMALLPGEEETEKAIASFMRDERAKKKKRFSEPFAPGRLRRYIVVSLCLFALSFFVEYTNYFRLLSALCLSFGAITWWLNNAAPEPAARS